ncbi:MAG: pyridoxal phosphate-dependent aminotransferase [Bradymonadaceae bacterium]
MDLSARINRVEPSPTLSITAKANALKAEGVDVVSFSAGEPDFDTPELIVEAAKSALDEGKTRYTASRGIVQLREAIAEDYARRGRQVTADEVVVTVGGKQALYNATQCLFEEGDELVVPAPYWVSYPAQLELAGAEPVTVECGIETDFKLTPEQLDETLAGGDITGLILCTPSNPTGSTYDASELEAVGEVLRDYPDVTVMFDAIYDQLYYGGDLSPDLVDTVPELADRVVTFNGFSKAYAMTGWRLGYAIGPQETIDAMAKLQTLIDERRNIFERRRDLIVDKLEDIDGVDCPTPGGAFYVFPDFSAYTGDDGRFEDDFELAEHLLEEAHAAVVPGSAFGSPGNLRLSYAMGDDEIVEGVNQIADAL